jgi:hypothetical protein
MKCTEEEMQKALTAKRLGVRIIFSASKVSRGKAVGIPISYRKCSARMAVDGGYGDGRYCSSVLARVIR